MNDTQELERYEGAWPVFPDPKLAEKIVKWVGGSANPAEIGLPGYTSLRPPQKNALWHFCKPDSAEFRVNVWNMPTGSGKSLAALTLARLCVLNQPGLRVLIITGSRQLQDQYARDFKTASKDIRGKANYICTHDFDRETKNIGAGGQELAVQIDFSLYMQNGAQDRAITVETAPCNFERDWQCPTKTAGSCLYYAALTAARQSKVVVANYAWWLANSKNQAGEFDLLFIDEAHNLENLLCGHLTSEFSLNEVKRQLGTPAPVNNSAETVTRWLQDGLERCREREGSVPRSDRARLNKFKREFEKCAEHHSADWVRVLEDSKTVQGYGKVGAKLKCAPVSAQPYLSLVFREVPKIVMISATISPATMNILGFEKGGYAYLSLNSTFDPARRPFYVLEGARMSGRMDAQTRLNATADMAEDISEIARLRPGFNGLVQTVSYERARLLIENMTPEARQRVITHGRGGAEMRAAIERFKRAKPGAIFVSPAAQEGVDLPHHLCRWQVIAKIPFLDPRDPMNAAKQERFKDYGFHTAGVAVTQMYGRLMRAGDDWGETFMLDSAWGWARKRIGNSAPKELWEAEKMCGEEVPAPPRFACSGRKA